MNRPRCDTENPEGAMYCLNCGARRLSDQRQRMTLYSQADGILVEEAVVVPLFYNRNILLIKPWVRNFPMSARGGWFWKDIIIELHQVAPTAVILGDESALTPRFWSRMF